MPIEELKYIKVEGDLFENGIKSSESLLRFPNKKDIFNKLNELIKAHNDLEARVEKIVELIGDLKKITENHTVLIELIRKMT